MWKIFKPVLLSLGLLGAAALTLLLSDLHSRVGQQAQDSAATQIPIVLLKHVSNLALDDVEQGCIAGLAAGGFKDGERITLTRYTAEGDLPTANAIAKRMTDGSFKMAISISTMALQCVANANRDGRAVHVFGAVTDPAGAGVGIQQMGSTNKPPWLTGIGTFQPVAEILRDAKRLWPGLKVVGVVWNPSERNSEACTIKARAVCRELGMQLLEANAEQSKDVREAADSLVSRGVQAFWTGADVTVMSAPSSLVDAAARGKIPILSNVSGMVHDGSLFDLGANYFEVGQRVAEIACSILNGQNPATITVTNFMPERVMLNKQVLKKMRD
ncbi:MAG: ABC transporter substrate-binding protein, partial [Verrucomicrobiia bacterium]